MVANTKAALCLRMEGREQETEGDKGRGRRGWIVRRMEEKEREWGKGRWCGRGGEKREREERGDKRGWERGGMVGGGEQKERES